MTHEELLAKIDTLEARYTDYPSYLALRAVVELHKPEPDYWGGDVVVCRQCGNYDIEVVYPCPTIQKIIENLQ